MQRLWRIRIGWRRATIAIWHGCAEAAKTGAAYDPGPGDFTVYPLHLPEGVRLVGKRGKTVLRSADGRPIVLASKLRSLLIEGISFYGSAKSANSSLGLIHFEDVETFQLHGAEIADHDGVGVANLRSGGEVLGCTIHDIGDAGYHSTDGLGVAFGRDGDGNRIQGCGNAGVRIWTSQPWIHDGSTIRNNNISKVRSESGGMGQNGNGVSIFRAADVTVEDNDIDECAFSAVRNNGGKDFRAARNRCSNLGERAMYAEFDFKNAVFENNTIATAAAGISLTNFDRARNVGCGGRAVGNEISHLVDEAAGFRLDVQSCRQWGQSGRRGRRRHPGRGKPNHGTLADRHRMRVRQVFADGHLPRQHHPRRRLRHRLHFARAARKTDRNFRQSHRRRQEGAHRGDAIWRSARG